MNKDFVCKPDGSGYKQLHKYLVDNESKVMTYQAREGVPKKRSMDSNALQAVWIREVSDFTGEGIPYVRSYVKLNIGLPVLQYDVDQSDLGEVKAARMINYTLNKIGFDQMNPKQKFNVMEMFAVTSQMSRRQHKKMLDDMANHYADKIGLVLVSNSKR